MTEQAWPTRTIVLSLLGVLGLGIAAQADEAAAIPDAIRSAPVPNTWVEVVKGDASGRRLAPIFFYEPESGRVVRAAGGGPGIAYWDEEGNPYDRYDTEELDLAAGKWMNAYPPGQENGRPESGAVQGFTLKPAKSAGKGLSGHTWLGLDGEQPRIKNWPVFNQWAYVPGKKTLYVTFGGGQMLAYDVARRTWAEPKADTTNYKGGARWCALCYDPVNGELVQVGGHGGEPGTWIFDLAKHEWRKLDCGSAALKGLGATAAWLRWRTICLLGAAANRFTVAETGEEAKVDLAGEARNLAAAFKKLGEDAKAAKADENEKGGVARAAELSTEVSDRYGITVARLEEPVNANTLGELRALKFKADQLCDGLAAEPPPRGLSPAVYDPEHKKIVVFGGDQLDRTLSDTWVYDCAARRWEQRFPKSVPCPRAGHLMVWLADAKRVFLDGGYSRVPIPQDMWSYDVAGNEWRCLGLTPLKDGPNYSKSSPGVPNASMQGYPIVGAALPGDVVVAASPLGSGLMACRVAIAKAQPTTSSEANGVAPASYTINPIDPARWEKLAKPDPEANIKFLKDLPANQWHAFKFPAYAPGGSNRWGTAPYDPDRHQFLLWSGGHATSWEDEVDHFSVRGSVWTISYPPDSAINPHATLSTWAGYGGTRTFFDRVTPGHAYHFVAYDPSGVYFYRSAAYDVRAREWRKPFPGYLGGGDFLLTTPHGVVSLSAKGNCRFDAKAGQWEKLTWDGPPISKFWCDSFTAAYDSKRDSLWAFGTQVVRYNFKTGTAEVMKTEAKSKAGEWFFCRESVCVPDADLVLSPVGVKSKDGWQGWAAWDLTAQKYLAVEIPRNDGGKLVPFTGPETAHCALAYDAELNVVLMNDMARRAVWVMRFDRRTAKIADAE